MPRVDWVNGNGLDPFRTERIGTAEVLAVRLHSVILVGRQGDAWLRNELARGFENGV